MNGIKQEVDDDPSYGVNTTNCNTFLQPTLCSQNVSTENSEDGTAFQSLSTELHSASKEPKKRGRPKKVKEEETSDGAVATAHTKSSKSAEKKLKQENLTDHLTVKKKGLKKDRFNGMPEEEVLQRVLPDHIAPNLDILIIGINPGLFAAYVGHHYAGPGNHFWKCLYLSGMIPEPMNAYDDFKLLEHGVGFTNVCARTTRGSADLRRNEIKEGAEILKRKLLKYKPKIAVFNGKGIYEVFSGKKDFTIGKQPDILEGIETVFFVMPSSSARCAQLPRAADKVPFYLALKKLRDYLKGEITDVQESEFVFPTLEMKCKTAEVKTEVVEEESGELAVQLTIDQIQMQAEYLEALAASAEGREIPKEVARNQSKSESKIGIDEDEDTQSIKFEEDESSRSSSSSEFQKIDVGEPGSFSYAQSLLDGSSFDPVPDEKDEPVYNVLDYTTTMEEVIHNGNFVGSRSQKSEQPAKVLPTSTAPPHSSEAPYYTSLGPNTVEAPKVSVGWNPPPPHPSSQTGIPMHNLVAQQQQQQHGESTRRQMGYDAHSISTQIQYDTPPSNSSYFDPGSAPSFSPHGHVTRHEANLIGRPRQPWQTNSAPPTHCHGNLSLYSYERAFASRLPSTVYHSSSSPRLYSSTPPRPHNGTAVGYRSSGDIPMPAQGFYHIS